MAYPHPHQGPPQGQAYHPGPPQGANNGLPPGWIQEWDAPDNRYFYINQHTGERTFNRPSATAGPNHNLPPGWVAEWDAPDRRWFFVNQRTGERSWDPPRGPPPPAQYTQVHTSGQGPMGSTYQQTQTEVVTQAPQQKNHNLAYGAGGAVAGLAAGALLMHEGDKVEEHWKRDKEKWEDDFDGRRRRDYGGDGYDRRGGDTIVENQTFVNDNDRYGGGYSRGGDTIVENQTFVDDNDRYGGGYSRGDDTVIQNETIVNDDRYGGDQSYQETTVVQDDGYGDDGYRRDNYRDDGFVDDAARWTGDKVQEVDDIPEDAARWTGDKVQEVEDIPEDAARWTDDKVDDVEGDFRNVEGSYDEGRDDRQDYDDDRY